MKRGWAICPAGHWDSRTAVDRVLLDSSDRHRRRIAMAGERGTAFLLDLDEPVMLCNGDGIVLDDGRVVLVAGMPEALLELTAPTPRDMVRLAWHLGNRHTDIQIVGDRLRIRHDHVLKDMAEGLGIAVKTVEAPFDPVPTPGQARHDHESGHGHEHGHHDHAHHDHEHKHGS